MVHLTLSATGVATGPSNMYRIGWSTFALNSAPGGGNIQVVSTEGVTSYEIAYCGAFDNSITSAGGLAAISGFRYWYFDVSNPSIKIQFLALAGTTTIWNSSIELWRV